MALYSFTPQTGFFSYEVSINPPVPTGTPFVFGFACSGCLDENIVTFVTANVFTFSNEQMVLFEGTSSGFMSFVGQSGKLTDADGNYFQSYQSGANFGISGNVFTGRHNYFYQNTEEPYALVNSNCGRATGTIDSFFIVNVPKDDFNLQIYN